MQVVLLGAPGSGKGTQGVAVARHLGVAHVSSGELLRAHVASGSNLGHRVAGCIARGELVPDDLVLAIVGDALTGAVNGGGYVLDGIPRTLAQAERAYALAKPAGLVADAVIYLDVPDEVARSAWPDARRRAGKTTRTLIPIDATTSAHAVTKAIIDRLRSQLPPRGRACASGLPRGDA